MRRTMLVWISYIKFSANCITFKFFTVVANQIPLHTNPTVCRMASNSL
jgi:hypothetical protein